MLAEARTPSELRDLRDYATGAKAWAKARGLGVESENEATEVILRAEREIGRILREMRENGLISDGNPHLRGTEVVTTKDLVGFSARDRRASDWMRLSDLPAEKFEAMLAAAKAIEGARIAKVNFYTAIDRATDVRGEAGSRSTPTDPGFDALRRGAFALLGWRVEEDGREGPTENGLLSLPEDELVVIANIIRSLAVAYNEAKAARG